MGEPGYTGDDLTLDAVRVLDGLGIPAAHLVGVSMGGGIAQDLAVRFPDRVLSLTLIATSTAFARADETALPPPEPRILALFDQPEPDLDWSDEDAVVDEMVRTHEAYAGSSGFEEDRVREISRRWSGGLPTCEASVTNHWKVAGRRRPLAPHHGRRRGADAGAARHGRPALPAPARRGARE